MQKKNTQRSSNGAKQPQKKKPTTPQKQIKPRNLSIRPILLKGHERPLTTVKYNRDGDLLFTSARDSQICLWYADTGERIGSYKGHLGAVLSFDVTWDSELLITASADSTVKLFRVETGEQLANWEIKGRAQSVQFNLGCTQFLVGVNSGSTLQSKILVYPFNKDQPGLQDKKREPKEIVIKNETENIKMSAWGYLNESIVTVTDKGFLYVHSPETGALLCEPKHDHNGPINSVNFSKDQTMFITCSDDFTARLYDAKTFQMLKTYETDYPVNSASISPIRDHVILGGGLHAMGTALGATDTSQFATRFFHLIDEEELASVKGHFGPVNTIAYNPDGKSFTTGSEDGTVRIHPLTEDYLDGALEESAEAELNSQQ
eukprot:TRINITY_DN1653_c0_g3_i1.p1 TRINITY_DN1653_c0_g3~~TRINITY_DN1653_c0_g3_i1.p1  ORF type:complete len:375 (-),score=80.57 TRINITY_DN1653_c0_g3_i1:73-1197(-)